jgi:heavy metal translocating P-type ATPase
VDVHSNKSVPGERAFGPGAWSWVLLAVSVTSLTVGGALWLAGAREPAAWAWGTVTAVVTARLVVTIAGDLRRGAAGVDLIALLAMAGALALGEHLTGVVIAVMLTGGESLEDYAAGRARRELSALLARAPRRAHLLVDGVVTTVDVERIRPGDRLLVRTGEVVAVDGIVEEAGALFDESALTGESRPVERGEHERVASGAINAGMPVRLRAVATEADSTYAGIVRLVRQAAADRAPFARLADRYALAFVPLTLAVAGAAWAVSADPVRALAVLVVATPCPLILAAPIALVGGVSRAARRGVIVKGAGALEQLAAARTVVFDKTGTLTAGTPTLAEVVAVAGHATDEVLRLAAGLEQASAHVYAPAVVRAATSRGLDLPFPTGVVEQPGEGIEGEVDGRRVRVGSAGWAGGMRPLPATARSALRRADLEGVSVVLVTIDATPAGVLVLDDPIRPETARVIRALRGLGVAHVLMLTGDDAGVAELVGAAIGVDRVLAQRSPADKIAAVRDLAERSGPVAMVGDGVNDAPALAGADVGVAMGARGATASSEAADIVITVDRLDRLAEAMTIARRSRHLALQSVIAGMGLSLIAMGFAAAGFIAPVAGALLQEIIDVAVIANALRVLRVATGPHVSATDRATSARFRAEHQALLGGLDELKAVADGLASLPARQAAAELEAVRTFLGGQLLPHEHAEEATLYPRLTTVNAGEDPTGPLIGVHREIERLVHLLDGLTAQLPPDGPSPEDRVELRRLLYGLHAILRLHFAQEEELYVALDDSAPAARGALQRA